MTFKHSCNFIADDGRIFLVRCEECGRENWAMSVASGVCCWCGYDANAAQRQIAEAALEEMAAISQELGLYDLPEQEAS